jgi:hypothetical protein
MVHDLQSMPRNGQAKVPQALIARRSVEGLISYARIGVGRPAGALTPADARAVVAELTQSGELASQAEALIERCDRVLFSKRPAEADAGAMLADARALFAALGRAPACRGAEVSESPAPAIE